MKLADRQQVLAAVSAGATTPTEIAQRLGIHRVTAQKWLQELVSYGDLERSGHGRYRSPQAHGPVTLSESAQRVLEVIERLAPDAHLTGFDLLAPYAHQFMVEYPHLVYVEPAALETATFELANAGFAVAVASHRSGELASTPSETVIVRAQPNADQFGVRGPLAPREKAWVDTLRETLRGHLPFDLVELGRVLRAMIDAGADLPALRNYARRMGYQRPLAVALTGDGDGDPRAEALRAGFVS